MNNKINNSKLKPILALLPIVIIGIATYMGFTPLFESAPFGKMQHSVLNDAGMSA